MKVDSPLVLYRSKRFFSAFPSVVTTASGNILLAFRRAPDHRWLLGDIAPEDFNSVDHVHFRSHIAFMRFDPDINVLLQPQILPVHAEAGDQDGNLFRTRAGRLFQYSFRWYPITIEVRDKLEERGVSVTSSEHMGAGYIFHSSYIRYSDDEGCTWSAPFEVPADPKVKSFEWPEITGTGAFKGRMIECDNGDLLLAGYFWSIEGEKEAVTRFFRSCDQGESWHYQEGYVSAGNVGLQEPTLARWPEGKITAFHRTKNNDDKLIISQSDDGGYSFGTPETVDIIGHPYDGLVLQDGRLLLVYGYRHNPMGVRARIVEQGQDIASAPEIIIRDDSPSRDTGYPSATLLKDGRVLIAYYIADDKGIRGIEASVLELC
ncbi:sialidase family protein [Kordiimonas pumila]|uniref:Sialidase family protein n=1 Tax=Kordiimonas pumila TaxID=2161677 RepID=A0ABV7D861_9PROT|nr:sialidase family protein [Kordiimonas pumila]